MGIKKDVSTLRPFDSEAARNGEKVCWCEDGMEAKAVFFHEQYVIPIFPTCENTGQAVLFDHDECIVCLRMAPLFWCEGKAVYKRDKLFWKDGGGYSIIVGPFNEYGLVVCNSTDRYGRHMCGEVDNTGMYAEQLTWENTLKPVKRFVNVYRTFDTREEANRDPLRNIHKRIKCVEVEIDVGDA